MTITHTPRQLIDSAELRRLWPVGRTTFYKTIKLDDFPAPVQLVDGGDYLWHLDEVEAWLEIRRTRPGRTTTSTVTQDIAGTSRLVPRPKTVHRRQPAVRSLPELRAVAGKAGAR